MSIPGYSERVTNLQELIKTLGGKAGEVALYCQNEACGVRQFTIKVKPYGEDIPMIPCCPFCRSEQIVFSWIRSGADRQYYDLANALFRVGEEFAKRENNGIIELGKIDKHMIVLCAELGLDPQQVMLDALRYKT